MPRIEQLHADLDKLINERICDVAETISGVPYDVIKMTLTNPCSAGFCKCRAIEKMAAGDDGI